jgi:hypothetical protein
MLDRHGNEIGAPDPAFRGDLAEAIVDHAIEQGRCPSENRSQELDIQRQIEATDESDD